MKKALPLWLMVFCSMALGQTDTLGPVAGSNSQVTFSGYDQYRSAMQTGFENLGKAEMIDLVFKWGLQVGSIPTDSTPVAVTANRYDRILNPALKTSLLRTIGDAVIQKTLKQRPPTLPRDPLLVSVFVATATDTYSATRSTKLRAKIESLQEPVSFGNGE